MSGSPSCAASTFHEAARCSSIPPLCTPAATPPAPHASTLTRLHGSAARPQPMASTRNSLVERCRRCRCGAISDRHELQRHERDLSIYTIWIQIDANTRAPARLESLSATRGRLQRGKGRGCAREVRTAQLPGPALDLVWWGSWVAGYVISKTYPVTVQGPVHTYT